MYNLIRNISVFLIPAIATIAFYLVSDPFRVIGSIEEQRAHFIASSDDYYSVERFIENQKWGIKYKRILLGNSKVMAYQEAPICENDQNCSFYNFGAPGESLLNIYKKMNLVLESDNPIDRVYLILDHKILMNERNTHPSYKGPVYEHHPLVSDNSWLSFHTSLMKYFIKDGFFAAIVSFKLFGYQSWMAKFFNDPESFEVNPYDAMTNQVSNSNKNLFTPSDLIKTKDPKSVEFAPLSEGQIEILEALKARLNGIDLVIILGPLLADSELNPGLLSQLEQHSGARVFDFRNFKNKGDQKLWYDLDHYSNEVGQEILNQCNSQLD